MGTRPPKTPTTRAGAARKPAAAAKKSVARADDLLRGDALVDVLVARLNGPGSKVADPQPLTAGELRAAEDAAGVALSPAMHAMLAFDAGYLRREARWLDGAGTLLARPTFALLEEHAGELAGACLPLCEARFTGLALPLDVASDSLSFLYLGDPDEHGEYPVLSVDHDGTTTFTVQEPGFDVWLAKRLGIKVGAVAAAVRATSLRLLGTRGAVEADVALASVTEAVSGPAPGSVKHRVFPARPVAAPQALGDEQLQRALTENAGAGSVARLEDLVREARTRADHQAWLDEALVAATKASQLAALRLLLAGGASPDAAEWGSGALARGIDHGCSAEIVAALLAAGASPDSPSVNGETALFAAVKERRRDVVQMLLDKGANADHATPDGTTALHAAAVGSDPELIDLLCAFGAKPNGRSATPPLHLAIEKNRLANAERLLARGAAIDGRSRYLARTALHCAFETGNDDAARRLIALGADRTLKDERGLSFEAIYGPGGEDVRPLEITYTASTEPQRLVVALTLAVTSEHDLSPRVLRQDHLSALARAGALGGASFDPVSSRADVFAPAPPDLVSTGFHERSFELEVAGVDSAALRLFALTLLGGAGAQPDIALRRSVRVVALSLRGERGGASLRDDAARRFLDDPGVQIRRFAAPLPFTFVHEETREAPSVHVVLEEPSAATGLLVGHRIDVWWRLSRLWPLVSSPEPPALQFMPTSPPAAVGSDFTFVAHDLASPPAARPQVPRFPRFPYPPGLAAEALENVMRTLHRDHPVRSVTLRT